MELAAMTSDDTETLQAARRRIAREQAQGTTFSRFAESEATEPRGRFTATEKSVPVGLTENAGAVYPPGPQWTTDPGSQVVEPPLPTHENADLNPSPNLGPFSGEAFQGTGGAPSESSTDVAAPSSSSQERDNG
jgi:hypothetical protein